MDIYTRMIYCVFVIGYVLGIGLSQNTYLQRLAIYLFILSDILYGFYRLTNFIDYFLNRKEYEKNELIQKLIIKFREGNLKDIKNIYYENKINLYEKYNGNPLLIELIFSSKNINCLKFINSIEPNFIKKFKKIDLLKAGFTPKYNKCVYDEYHKFVWMHDKIISEFPNYKNTEGYIYEINMVLQQTDIHLGILNFLKDNTKFRFYKQTLRSLSKNCIKYNKFVELNKIINMFNIDITKDNYIPIEFFRHNSKKYNEDGNRTFTKDENKQKIINFATWLEFNFKQYKFVYSPNNLKYLLIDKDNLLDINEFIKSNTTDYPMYYIVEKSDINVDRECGICYEYNKKIRFGCNHVVCKECFDTMSKNQRINKCMYCITQLDYNKIKLLV